MTWPECWQRTTPATRVLSALTPLYLGLAGWQSRRQKRRRSPLPVPVLIVGNLVVGGSGKTPFIEWLARQMPDIGVRAGIVSRGYGVRRKGTLLVTDRSSADEAGDEPLLLARATGLPVCVGRDRAAAARRLLQAFPDTGLIISDDGLQHHSLPRQLSLCLFDGHAGFGNGRVLPAGPLREPLARARECDLVISKGPGPGYDALERGGLEPRLLSIRLDEPRHHDTGRPLSERAGGGRPVAVCGIGQPDSFFRLLRGWCSDFDTLVLPDHGGLSRSRLADLRDRCVVTTPKDVVKLPPDHGLKALYVASMRVSLNTADREHLLRKIAAVMADFAH